MTDHFDDPIINDQPVHLHRDLLVRQNLIAFPFHWQVPAKTEKAAFESIRRIQHQLPFEYIGFAWASMIDGLCRDSDITWALLKALKNVIDYFPALRRRITVAQHIQAIQFIEVYHAIGITDLFWSHATQQKTMIKGIKIHPFPLFPAQTTDSDIQDINPARSRRYLANFIGAYNSFGYISNVREVILSDKNEKDDLLLIKRDSWHFERIVYEEQINGKKSSKDGLLKENQHREEYLSAMKESWFTLCPTGSGPNSIRIFEALSLQSIPILLTKDLRLPGPIELWEKATIIEEDSAAGYQRGIEKARKMDVDDRMKMVSAGMELCKMVLPPNYAQIIIDGLR
jgi:hypothetical protein